MKSRLKNILPRGFFGRSLLILVIPVVVVQVVTTYVFFDRSWAKVTDRLAYAVGGEIASIADFAEDHPDRHSIDQITAYAYQELDLLVSYEKGAKFKDSPLQSDRSLLAQSLQSALNSKFSRPHTIRVNMSDKWVDITLGLKTGVLHVAVPQWRLYTSATYIFLLWMIGASIILLAIAILFMRNQIRPIRRLAVAAVRFGRGLDTPANFKPEGAYEIRQAARAFIGMQERIRRQVQQRTSMLAGVSHDLRTPLTRMKLQVAMLGDGPDAQALAGDIADMERMINAYLDFARGEGGEAVVPTDIAALLASVAQSAQRQGADITVDAPQGLRLEIRPVAFERAIANLVSNAQKYAHKIWLSAAQGDDVLTITVDDDGPGIAEDKYEDMFRPFVRGEPSRNPETGGVGLGLPIAQDVVIGHGGRIALSRSVHGGLRVTVELPL